MIGKPTEFDGFSTRHPLEIMAGAASGHACIFGLYSSCRQNGRLPMRVITPYLKSLFGCPVIFFNFNER
jgi:hypothetical protein